MKRLTLLLCLAAAGCSTYWGSTTTDRPALTDPAVRPDGAFWDAVAAAQRGDVEAFRFMLSPRFIHDAILPRENRPKLESAEEFDRERAELEAELAPHEATVKRMVAAYMQSVVELTSNKLVEVGQPDQNIEFRDGYRRAIGPNRASVTVLAWSRGAMGPGAKPDTLVVKFVQDGDHWLIDDFEPNRLKGAFIK